MSIDIKKMILVGFAAAYEKILTDEQVNYYADHLESNLTDEELGMACKIYYSNEKNEFFPRPVSKLVALIKKPIDSESLAVDTASKVIEAVSKYGWSGYSAAMEFIGPTGQHAVDRFGGWSYICENLGNGISLTTFQAQCREILKANHKIEAVKTDHLQIDSLPKGLLEFKLREIPK